MNIDVHCTIKQTQKHKVMKFSTAQIAAKATSTTFIFPKTWIQYVGTYVMQGETQHETKLIARFNDWTVELESENGEWFATKAYNIMTGTEYNTPTKWFENKMK